MKFFMKKISGFNLIYPYLSMKRGFLDTFSKNYLHPIISENFFIACGGKETHTQIDDTLCTINRFI